jgi:hypothetical protein
MIVHPVTPTGTGTFRGEVTPGSPRSPAADWISAVGRPVSISQDRHGTYARLSDPDGFSAQIDLSVQVDRRRSRQVVARLRWAAVSDRLGGWQPEHVYRRCGAPDMRACSPRRSARAAITLHWERGAGQA